MTRYDGIKRVKQSGARDTVEPVWSETPCPRCKQPYAVVFGQFWCPRLHASTTPLEPLD